MDKETWDALGIDRATLHALKNMVRIGTVSEVDGRRVRVAWGSARNTKSGWLTSLRHVGELKPGETVLILYVPVFDGDGFVLGGL